MLNYSYKEPGLLYKTFSTSVILLLILIAIFGSFLLAPKIGYISFFAGFFTILSIVIFIHSKNTAYICKSCNNEFEISFWKDLTTAHSPGKKLLKCPKCSYRDYASELIKSKIEKTPEI